jgi:hypothetical protein
MWKGPGTNIQHSFIIKVLKKLGIQGMYLYKTKVMHDKPIASLHSKGKTETISSNVKNETRVSTFSTLIHYSTGIPSRAIKQEKEIKGIINRKERSQIILPCV